MIQRHRFLLGILALALLPRLIHLDSRPLGPHAWRQCDTASVARNFHENGYQLVLPQIDWAVPGYVEMEFPLYPWVTSLGYAAVGEAEWLARLLAIAGSLVTILFLYLIVARILNSTAGLWAAFFLAVFPSSLYFGRAIMPESWMLATSAAGLYWFLRWSEEDSWGFYVLSVVAVALACLLKLTNLFLGLPLLWLGWRRYGSRTLLQWKIWLHALLVALPVGLWYWHAHNLGATYGASFNILTTAGSDKWGNWSLLAAPRFYSRLVFGHVAGRLVTWVGFALLLAALFLPRRTQRERLLDIWFLAVVIVLLIANQGAYDHEYYSLPLLLPAAGFLGKLFDRHMETHRLLLRLSAIAIATLGLYHYAGYLEEEAGIGVGGDAARRNLVAAEILADNTSPPEIVVSCNATNPTWLYLSRRRGWGRTCGSETQASMRALLDSGATSMMGRWRDLESPDGERVSRYLKTVHSFVYDDGEWFVARLGERLTAQESSSKRIYAADFRSKGSAGLEESDWQFESGEWNLDDTGLHGKTDRGRLSAVAPPSLPPEVAGQVAITFRMRHLRGRGTEQRITVQAWKRNHDTHVSIVFRPRKGTVTLLLTEGGKVLFRESQPIHLRIGKSYRMQLVYDHLGFHVLLNRRSTLSAPVRFATPPSGGIAIQGRNLEIDIERLQVRVQGPGVEAPLVPPGVR